MPTFWKLRIWVLGRFGSGISTKMLIDLDNKTNFNTIPNYFTAKPCGKNEEFSNCTNDECTPRNCSQLGFPMPCPKSDSSRCTKGCVCKEGFVRADNGTCIRKKDCRKYYWLIEVFSVNVCYWVTVVLRIV